MMTGSCLPAWYVGRDPQWALRAGTGFAPPDERQALSRSGSGQPGNFRMASEPKRKVVMKTVTRPVSFCLSPEQAPNRGHESPVLAPSHSAPSGGDT